MHISEAIQQNQRKTFEQVWLTEPCLKGSKEMFLKNHPDWIWDKYNEPIFENLCKYFNNDKSGKYDIHKGLFLFSKNGTGKTTFLTEFKMISGAYHYDREDQSKVYKIKNCSDIFQDAKNCGGDTNAYQDGFIAFDELGREGVLNSFGNKKEVMEEIICQRCDKGLLTIIATNLTPDDVLDRYGSRLHSRLFGNFNIIAWGTDAVDYRMKDYG